MRYGDRRSFSVWVFGREGLESILWWELRSTLLSLQLPFACRTPSCPRPWPLGLRTATVYAPEDSHSMHVHAADEAFELPVVQPGRSPYLEISKIVEAALACRAGQSGEQHGGAFR